jgi:hypothetical protein
MFKILDGVRVQMTEAEIAERQAQEAEWLAGADDRKAQEARAERDMKLATEVDPIAGNALRWASLTTEQQQAWADYRQALLDVPSQSGFPHDVVWPTKP